MRVVTSTAQSFNRLVPIMPKKVMSPLFTMTSGGQLSRLIAPIQPQPTQTQIMASTQRAKKRKGVKRQKIAVRRVRSPAAEVGDGDDDSDSTIVNDDFQVSHHSGSL
jgi:hypothetical protein